MAPLLRLLLGLLAVAGTFTLDADGIVVPQYGYARVDIPDQRTLIHSNGVERLVIETSFVGPGTNFAWVVPLPSVPTIEPVYLLRLTGVDNGPCTSTSTCSARSEQR